MILTEQLAQPAAAQTPFPETPFPETDLFLTMDAARTGMLANVSVQIVSFSPSSLKADYDSYFRNTKATARLAARKERKFTPEGRNARIEASLRALNAPQPTDLPLQTWKAILEELEDED